VLVSSAWSIFKVVVGELQPRTSPFLSRQIAFKRYLMKNYVVLVVCSIRTTPNRTSVRHLFDQKERLIFVNITEKCMSNGADEKTTCSFDVTAQASRKALHSVILQQEDQISVFFRLYPLKKNTKTFQNQK
jgi:hypothetical protein